MPSPRNEQAFKSIGRSIVESLEKLDDETERARRDTFLVGAKMLKDLADGKPLTDQMILSVLSELFGFNPDYMNRALTAAVRDAKQRIECRRQADPFNKIRDVLNH